MSSQFQRKIQRKKGHNLRNILL